MAQTECVKQLDTGSIMGDGQKMETLLVSPGNKKLKQGRLPFKPLDQKSPGGNLTPGSKKRKLSDNESPSAKQAKTCKPVLSKPLLADGEHEVSSSSEAENTVPQLSLRQSVKMNTLDRFFKKPEVQEEISSTNEYVDTIDLTEDMECDTGNKDDTKPSKDVQQGTGFKHQEVTSRPCPESNNDKTEQKVDVVVLSTDVSTEPMGQNKTDSSAEEFKETSLGKSNVKDTSADAVKLVPGTEKCSKSNSSSAIEMENMGENENLDSSFVSDPLVCEQAIKTPMKEVSTPKMKKSGISPVSHTDSPSATSDATPSTSVKKRALSDSKKKERELIRMKVKEQKEKEREEKRLQKEKEKQEKEKEKLEKRRQKDQEKAEKEKQKQEEKEKKEKERLEKLQQKEEEKKKKEELLEAKLEEKKKKEEEKRQKEEEKRQKEEEKRREEEEKTKKQEKVKETFKGFFIKQAPTTSPPKAEQKNSLFKPFEMKPNMRLAPSHRVEKLGNSEVLDKHLEKQDCEHHYLSEVKSDSFKPRSNGRTFPRKLEETDVEMLCHDSETIKKVTHKVKLLQFHENYRPPYYGTWSKSSSTLTPRNPFKQDELLFDYEVDSDDEWEEEEPGESVSSDENDDEKDDEKDDDDEDGWMVPHGHLSEDEGINDEDDEESPEMLKMKQHQAQLAWENELRQRTQPMKQTVIGCYWGEETTAIAAQQLQKLLSFKAVCLVDGPISTGFSRSSATDDCDSTLSGKDGEPTVRWNRKSVPEEAMPDLIRLVHGNRCGIKKIIKEFRMYWKLKTSDKAPASVDISMDVDEEVGMAVDKTPPKSKENSSEKSGTATVESTATPGSSTPAVKESEFAISKRQLELKIPAIAVREKRGDVKICWYVNVEVLKQYNMEDIRLPNTWEYVTQPQPVTVTPKAEEPSSGRATLNIMQFAQPMSLSQIQAAGSTSIAKDLTPSKVGKDLKAEVKMETESGAPSESQSAAKQPNDQKSIMHFMKFAAVGGASKPQDKPTVLLAKSSPAQATDGNTASLEAATPPIVGNGSSNPDASSISQSKPVLSQQLKSDQQMSPGIKRVNPVPLENISPNIKRITNKLPAKNEPQSELRVKPVTPDAKNSQLGIRRITPVKLTSPPQALIGGADSFGNKSIIQAQAKVLNNVDTKAHHEKIKPMDVDVVVLD